MRNITKIIKQIGLAGISFLCLAGLVACGAGNGDATTSGQPAATSDGSAQGNPVQTESAGPETTTAEAKESSVDFQTIKLTENNMTIYGTVYYAEKTDSGVHLEYFMSGGHWDVEADKYVEDKMVIREYDADRKVYRQLAQCLADAGVKKWDGYYESDPDVLDGYGFTFDAVLEDGTTINAGGSNSFPDGYGTLFSTLSGLCSTEELKNTSFDGGAFTLQLPKSWIGEVFADYMEGYTSFRLIDAPDHFLAGVYVQPYSEDNEEYILLGTFEQDETTYYIYLRDLTRLQLPNMNVLTAEQVAIVESAPDMIPEIAESFVLK